MATGQFCLKWNNFHNSIVTAFESLQSTEELVDVTLMCEGRNVKAHKVILSACSPYFRNLFKETPCKHPIIILKDVLYCDLVAILQFMYQGEVLVDQDGLASFLKTAELLQVSGLAGSTSSTTAGVSDEINNVPSPSVPSSKISVPLTTKPETLSPTRTKTPPSSPKPPPLVKVRNDIVPVVVEQPSVIEKENIISREELIEDEPMQSCSYQTHESVVIKTESADDQDYHELDYLEPIDDPGSTTTEEQSILERSLKAQGMSPHSTKLYSMDYPNQTQSQSHTSISINPPELATINKNKNNVEIVDSGKRKLMKSTATAEAAAVPAAKRLLVKTILPKVELKSVKCSDALHVTVKSDHHGAQIGNCPHCSKMYSNQSALKYHVRLVHSDMLNMFCCHLCPESFEFRESYKTHMWDKHNVRN